MTKIFAHRGLHLRETENTVASFLEARSLGVDGVELDIRRTRDGALVVHHDAEIAGVGTIAGRDCRDLPRGTATLAEALLACQGLVVNVEIKNSPGEPGYDPSDALAHQVVDEINELAWADHVIISSFDLPTCEAVRSASGTMLVGWLLDWKLDTLTSVQRAADAGLNAVHPHFRRTDLHGIAAARQMAIAVNVWTVNEPGDIERMLDLGVDSIISDDPGLALERVSARNA
ncbi:MAG: glycerophosphodiester phosphodiesterase [Actinomycetota bacterium]|jgi:glycerophosphoryl diester phosphodiesterase